MWGTVDIEIKVSLTETPVLSEGPFFTPGVGQCTKMQLCLFHQSYKTFSKCAIKKKAIIWHDFSCFAHYQEFCLPNFFSIFVQIIVFTFLLRMSESACIMNSGSDLNLGSDNISLFWHCLLGWLGMKYQANNVTFTADLTLNVRCTAFAESA